MIAAMAEWAAHHSGDVGTGETADEADCLAQLHKLLVDTGLALAELASILTRAPYVLRHLSELVTGGRLQHIRAMCSLPGASDMSVARVLLAAPALLSKPEDDVESLGLLCTELGGAATAALLQRNPGFFQSDPNVVLHNSECVRQLCALDGQLSIEAVVVAAPKLLTMPHPRNDELLVLARELGGEVLGHLVEQHPAFLTRDLEELRRIMEYVRSIAALAAAGLRMHGNNTPGGPGSGAEGNEDAVVAREQAALVRAFLREGAKLLLGPVRDAKHLLSLCRDLGGDAVAALGRRVPEFVSRSPAELSESLRNLAALCDLHEGLTVAAVVATTPQCIMLPVDHFEKLLPICVDIGADVISKVVAEKPKFMARPLDEVCYVGFVFSHTHSSSSSLL